MRNYSRIYAVYDADREKLVGKLYCMKAYAISYANKLRNRQPKKHFIVLSSVIDWISTGD